jgi:beta-glucanase (GH16 family)
MDDLNDDDRRPRLGGDACSRRRNGSGASDMGVDRVVQDAAGRGVGSKAALLAVVTLLCAFLVPSSGTADPTAQPLETDECGIRPPKPGGGLWSCTFADDFTGPALNRSYWTPLVQPETNGIACNIDSPQTHQVVDGVLRLTVRPVGNGVSCPVPSDGSAPRRFASASISTYYRWSQKYGRFEARYRNTATRASGLHEAFWLWPDQRYDRWNTFGEIDIAETYSALPDVAIPHLHDSQEPTGRVNTAWDCRASRGEWHTYTMEWSADRIEIFVDGKSCVVNTETTARFRAPYIIALSLILGDGWNNYDGRAPLPATMEVDYVRVWR